MNKHYFISEFGNICCVEDLYMSYEQITELKSVGNYFNSVEEANKRLGINVLLSTINNMHKKCRNITYEWRKNGHRYENPCIYRFNISIELFGGEFIKELLDKIFEESSNETAQ